LLFQHYKCPIFFIQYYDVVSMSQYKRQLWYESKGCILKVNIAVGNDDKYTFPRKVECRWANNRVECRWANNRVECRWANNRVECRWAYKPPSNNQWMFLHFYVRPFLCKIHNDMRFYKTNRWHVPSRTAKPVKLFGFGLAD
jgi:hypothetical protein